MHRGTMKTEDKLKIWLNKIFKTIIHIKYIIIDPYYCERMIKKSRNIDKQKPKRESYPIIENKYKRFQIYSRRL